MRGLNESKLKVCSSALNRPKNENEKNERKTESRGRSKIFWRWVRPRKNKILSDIFDLKLTETEKGSVKEYGLCRLVKAIR